MPWFASAIVPAAVVMVWLFAVITRRGDDARRRHMMTMSLLIYGMVACISFPALAFYAWGTPADTWVLAFFAAGLVSLVLSGLMKAFGLLQNRSSVS
jgi:hypothetical protein